MLKVIRNSARKIDFNKQKMVEPEKGETSFKDVAEFENAPSEREIDKKLVDLENTSQLVGKIQKEIDDRTKDLEDKENLLVQKEKELGKMAELWTSLNSVNLKELDKNELKKIVSEQEGFVKDLLEHYIESTEQEQKLVEEMEKLREKPWAGKGSSQIAKENEELKKRNKELTEEIDKVLDEIEEMQEGD